MKLASIASPVSGYKLFVANSEIASFANTTPPTAEVIRRDAQRFALRVELTRGGLDVTQIRAGY